MYVCVCVCVCMKVNCVCVCGGGGGGSRDKGKDRDKVNPVHMPFILLSTTSIKEVITSAITTEGRLEMAENSASKLSKSS